MYIFISPHFDDAIGSAGGTISRLVAKSKQVKIITIMGGSPENPTDAEYVLTRRKENTNACNILGVDYVNADFLDAIYRTEIDYSKKDSIFNQETILEQKLCDNITDYLIQQVKLDDIIIVPTAFGNHIDHKIVRVACEKLKRKISLYEDFFYNTRESSNTLINTYEIIELTDNEIQTKISAFNKYTSQIKSLFLTMEEMVQYFTNFHTVNQRPIERFSNVSIFD